MTRILLVDDDRRLAESLRRGLTAEGFTVELAHTGDDGLWKASEFDYDALVLDLMLPGCNGFQVSKRLRKDGVHTPILVLTARDTELDEMASLDAGADDYLSKPFSFRVLVARLRALVRRGAGTALLPLQVGDLVLDAARHRVHRGDVEIVLTAREFSVLEYLVRRAGQVVSKQQLLNGIWDSAFEGDPNLVEVYIRRLRRKVDEPFARHDIETIRGAGYRLNGST